MGTLIEPDARLFRLHPVPRERLDAGTRMLVASEERAWHRPMTVFEDSTGRRLYVGHYGARASAAELRAAIVRQWDGAT